MANALLWPRARFEWDDAKDLLNQRKHGVSFSEAQHAFVDPSRVVLRDVSHSSTETRFVCVGRTERGVLTVRFTYRTGVIRIYRAGYWRKGKRVYAEENPLYR